MAPESLTFSNDLGSGSLGSPSQLDGVFPLNNLLPLLEFIQTIKQISLSRKENSLRFVTIVLNRACVGFVG